MLTFKEFQGVQQRLQPQIDTEPPNTHIDRVQSDQKRTGPDRQEHVGNLKTTAGPLKILKDDEKNKNGWPQYWLHNAKDEVIGMFVIHDQVAVNEHAREVLNIYPVISEASYRGKGIGPLIYKWVYENLCLNQNKLLGAHFLGNTKGSEYIWKTLIMKNMLKAPVSCFMIPQDVVSHTPVNGKRGTLLLTPKNCHRLKKRSSVQHFWSDPAIRFCVGNFDLLPKGTTPPEGYNNALRWKGESMYMPQPWPKEYRKW